MNTLAKIHSAIEQLPPRLIHFPGNITDGHDTDSLRCVWFL